MMLVAGAGAIAAQTPETERLKTDLIGHTMGGREKCWKFQSVDQIKTLKIKKMTEDAQKRVYTLALELEASKACGKYAAEVRAEYAKTGAEWKCKQVGLLSLEKLE